MSHHTSTDRKYTHAANVVPCPEQHFALDRLIPSASARIHSASDHTTSDRRYTNSANVAPCPEHQSAPKGPTGGLYIMLFRRFCAPGGQGLHRDGEVSEYDCLGCRTTLAGLFYNTCTI